MARIPPGLYFRAGGHRLHSGAVVLGGRAVAQLSDLAVLYAAGGVGGQNDQHSGDTDQL